MTAKQAVLVALVTVLSSVAGYALYHSRGALTPWVTLKALLAPL